MKTKVYMPIGWAAGRKIDLPDALNMLTVEAMGARSDIMNPANKDSDGRKLGGMEYHLERLALALAVIAWQLDPQPTEGFTEQARRLGVTLPPEFSE